ncbi:MAG: hypothetical protein ABIH23_24365 [bacterium]
MDLRLGNRIIEIRERVVSNFEASHWEEIGLLTGLSDLIDGHPRLRQSLYWGDQDYAGNVLNVLKQIAEQKPDTLDTFERYLNEQFPCESHYVSARPSERRITFAPNVFQIPDLSVESNLVAVMMPFGAGFDPVCQAISAACSACGLRSLRADDIWEESTIIQDIFNLIFRAPMVVVDFTGKNPNVMYETGIAHTLGKLVVPISQSTDDIPFDMAHHRILTYLPNREGLAELHNNLAAKLGQASR